MVAWLIVDGLDAKFGQLAHALADALHHGRRGRLPAHVLLNGLMALRRRQRG